MPHRDLVVSAGAGNAAAGRRAALCEDGTLIRLAIDGDARLQRAGDVIFGRVRKINTGLGAAFVDIGADRDGLLMRADWGVGACSEGDAVLVRVLRAATSGKGPKLKRLTEPVGDTAGLRPPAFVTRAPSPVDALIAEARALGVEAVVCDDVTTAAALRRIPGWAGIVTLLPAAGSAFRACGLDAEIDAALAPVIPLPSGGRVTIAETPALTAIDVDSGSTEGGLPARTALTVNREAATAIGRAIRLRELAGTIVIDFVAMGRADHRAQVAAALRDALGGDDRHLRLAGFTRLGLFEVRRERHGPSLSEMMLTACPACGGTGRITAPAETARRAIEALTAEHRGHAAGALRIIAAPAVAAALRAEGRALLAAAEAALGRTLAVVEDPSMPADGFRLEATDRTQETKQESRR